MQEDKGHGFFYPFVFPFYQKSWQQKMWWVVVLTLIPILDFVFLRGWRLMLVKRMGEGDSEVLPNADIAEMLKKGCVLWFMTTFYVIIPTIIIFSVGAGEIGNLFSGLGCFWTSMFGNENDPSLYVCLKAEASEMMLRIMIEIVWLMVSGTLYRVAMIRYALTGNKRVFLNLPLNAFIALRNIKSFIMMWIFGIIMLSLFVLLGMIMTATVVLAPFIPLVVLLVYYYATGYEYGHLAHDIAYQSKMTHHE